MAPKKSFKNPNPGDGSIGSTLRTSVENFLSDLTFFMKGQVKTYQCPREKCSTTSIHPDKILEHVQKIHERKEYATILCPDGCSAPYATSAAMRRHRLRVHGNNHASCPVVGCQDNTVRERGYIFNHLRAAHSCQIPAAPKFPNRKWYVRAQKALENWAQAQGQTLDDDYQDMFLISTQRAAQDKVDESEQDDDVEDLDGGDDADDFESGPITNLQDFLRRLFDAPDQLKSADVAHLKGFSVNDPSLARFVTAMGAGPEPTKVAIKCLLLTSVIDWIETEEPDDCLSELFEADASIAENLSSGDPENEGHLWPYKSDGSTLYDVIYGLYIRGLFGDDKRAFVMRDYSNVVCMLGSEEEKEDAKTHKSALSSKVDMAITDEAEQLDFWHEVLMETLRCWLVDSETWRPTFFGHLEYEVGKKLKVAQE
ncbi:hypothetical protein HII31_00536 [Pseudocercospora fuligena]|uniref:C2H2-type domain-containing protein n=1 Tax=Pseudocercospora fuligena TaxID=685502 RepID=A0A8H6RUM4_9PEZI|nr:hypothetical protein HII31_00536 [Pseudocercospora fuligena]